jgi:hypothetical protein
MPLLTPNQTAARINTVAESAIDHVPGVAVSEIRRKPPREVQAPAMIACNSLWNADLPDWRH